MRERAPEPGSIRNSGLFRRFRALIPGRAGFRLTSAGRASDRGTIPDTRPLKGRKNDHQSLAQACSSVWCRRRRWFLIQSDSTSDAAVPAFWEPLIWHFKQPHLCTVESVSCFIYGHDICWLQCRASEHIPVHACCTQSLSGAGTSPRKTPTGHHRFLQLGRQTFSACNPEAQLCDPGSGSSDRSGRPDRFPAQRHHSANPVSSGDPSSIPTCSLPHGDVRLVPSPGVWKNDPICYLFLGQQTNRGAPARDRLTDSYLPSCFEEQLPSPLCPVVSHTLFPLVEDSMGVELGRAPPSCPGFHRHFTRATVTGQFDRSRHLQHSRPAQGGCNTDGVGLWACER
jgi:hypothetical protein